MLLGILPLGWARPRAVSPEEARAAEILTRREAVVIRSRENGETDSCLEGLGVFLRNWIGSHQGWAKNMPCPCIVSKTTFLSQGVLINFICQLTIY